ncbi:TPA: hypothetical protein GF146_23670 [Escherichia coli]|nr:hypothetical protein [Escherichia coli]
MIQRTAASPGFLSEAFRISEHPPGKGVSPEEGRASDDVGLRKGVLLEKWTRPSPCQDSRCRALHHACWIIVASEDGSLKSPSEHQVSLLSSNIT